ncbi:prolyl oligopeptidase family serine peptidase, partial [Nonomuraea sp. NPDC055795]
VDMPSGRHFGEGEESPQPSPPGPDPWRLWHLTNRLTKLNLPGTEFTPATGAATAKLRGWLGGNAVPRARSAAPMLVAQGLTDVLVSPAQTAKAAKHAQALGTATKLITYPGTDHFQILTSSAPDVLRWIDARLRR